MKINYRKEIRMKTLAIAGTFDTKGKEFKYIQSIAEELGLSTLMIHTGVFEQNLNRMFQMKKLH